MRRSGPSTFNMAFLDIMFCGFGAVVLLVMLLHGKTLQKREETIKDSSAEVERASILYQNTEEHLSNLRREVESVELAQGALAVEAEQLRSKIYEQRQIIDRTDSLARQQAGRIDALKREKKRLENVAAQLKSSKAVKTLKGRKKVGFDGEGQRQYLTGLKLGGKRTLILLDASASMLDETVVNVVRRRIMSAAIRRSSPKWQRVVRSLHWLLANLQSDRQFQVYSFNTQAQSLIPGTQGQWLSTNNSDQLQRAIAEARQIAPEKGTSLHRAFEIIKRLSPKPDSVLLLTDGLPTQGMGAPKSGTVSGEERERIFQSAVKLIPSGVPINILLFPLEGDPVAAAAYWQLAIDTQGSFITPSRDWP